MRKLGRRAALCAVLAQLVAGCAQQPISVDSEEQQVANVLDKLSGYASTAVNAQRELAMTADAKVQNAAARRNRLLSDLVSYDFYGNVELIVRDIADKYGYKLEVYGKPPPGNVITSVYVQKRAVLDVLKYIGYTSTQFIDINVKPDTIELHYKG